MIAQGAGNIASALFGGIPATGAIARTAANIKNGGRTPVAGMVHSLSLIHILWGGHLWNPSYCAVTVSDRSREQVLAYLEGPLEESIYFTENMADGSGEAPL